MNMKAYVDKDKSIFDDVGNGSYRLELVKQVEIMLGAKPQANMQSHHQKAPAAYVENDWETSGDEMEVLTAAELNLMMSSWMYSWIDFSCDGISDQGFPNIQKLFVCVFLLSFFYG